MLLLVDIDLVAPTHWWDSCRWCQRETGASFALNAMIEADQLVVLRGEPEWTKVPSESGAGQNIARCPTCKIALYSVYYANPAIAKLIRFVRVGTLDTPELLPPNAHIWTSEKQPWVVLSDKVPAFEVGYELEDIWPAERYAKLLKDHNVPAELSPEFP